MRACLFFCPFACDYINIDLWAVEPLQILLLLLLLLYWEMLETS
jgi:hypothetical protein